MSASERLTKEQVERWRIRMRVTEKWYGIPSQFGEADAICDLALRALNSETKSEPGVDEEEEKKQ